MNWPCLISKFFFVGYIIHSHHCLNEHAIRARICSTLLNVIFAILSKKLVNDSVFDVSLPKRRLSGHRWFRCKVFSKFKPQLLDGSICCFPARIDGPLSILARYVGLLTHQIILFKHDISVLIGFINLVLIKCLCVSLFLKGYPESGGIPSINLGHAIYRRSVYKRSSVD